jgi:hypothetical protein
MPALTEYGKIFRDWDGLLGAAEKRAAMLPGVDDHKAALEALLGKARELKLKQEGFAGDKKETTEQLKKVVKDGRDAASMLRAFVKSRIGLRTEVLKEFGISPTRSRKRAAKPPEEVPPANHTPGVTPPATNHTPGTTTTTPEKPAE